MSIIDDALKAELLKIAKPLEATNSGVPLPSEYAPDEDERKILSIILDSFRWSDIILRKPRREWNDLSTLTRMMVDQMTFNTYQPNNGQAPEGDLINSWKSHAMKPVARNKVISVAAHVTAKLMFPKIFASDTSSEVQHESATVMRELVEWASNQNDYSRNTLSAVINACVNPASFVHEEYAIAKRTIKTEKGSDNKWITKDIIDEDNSGFRLTQVPVDELFVANFYEPDIQRQNYLIWRRVQGYDIMAAKYSKRPNFKYVSPGVQILYNNANSSFYEVYDSNLQGTLCEEIIFYSKSLDLQIAVVNGVMMDTFDNPNPRIDKLYPFIGFGYEPFDEGRSIYHKSLVFKMQPDSDIITSLYQMVIDGTYLSVMPPLLVAGEQTIGADVIVPGLVTTTTDPNSAIVPIRAAQDIATGLSLLNKVEESVSETSLQDIDFSHKQTAYVMSAQLTQQNILIGPFTEMLKYYVEQYGRLVIGDIKQYLTIPDVDKIIDSGELIYKTFINHGKGKTKKINFSNDLSDNELSDEEQLKHSFDVLEKQGGQKSNVSLYDVNPVMFNNLKFECVVDPDVLNPMSDDLEKAMGLEVFDQSIQGAQAGVSVNLDEVFKDFVLQNYPKSNLDVDKYMKDAAQSPIAPGLPQLNKNQPVNTGQSNLPSSMNPAQSPMVQKITNNPVLNNNR
jgi:hypothetical protein